MNTNFKIGGLTWLKIKPESTAPEFAPEADALTIQLSEMLNSAIVLLYTALQTLQTMRAESVLSKRPVQQLLWLLFFFLKLVLFHTCIVIWILFTT